MSKKKDEIIETLKEILTITDDINESEHYLYFMREKLQGLETKLKKLEE